MSLGAKIVVSAMRGIKKTGLIKGPGPVLDAELRKARDYNRKHPYHEPTDRKAAYQTLQVEQYPCLVIRPENQAGKAFCISMAAEITTRGSRRWPSPEPTENGRGC